MAVLNFCKKDISPKKKVLLEKLTKKMDQKNKSGKKINKKIPHITTGSRRKRKNRLIEIGWLRIRPKLNKLRQVGAKVGTSKIAVDKDIKCVKSF